MKNQEFILGEIKATLFESFENFYKVLLVEVLDTDTSYSEEEIVITGHFGAISSGEQYRFFGQLIHHAKYGLQFQADRYSKEQPTNEEALIKFLSGKQFPGIGEVTANRLVDELGTQLIQKISEDENLLDSITFLSKKQRNSLLEGIKKSTGDQQAILFLNKLGLGNERAYRVYDQLKEKTIEKVKSNPYILYELLDHFSFERADQIAVQLDIAPDDLSRIEAGILYTLSNHSFGTGDTYMDISALMKSTLQMLEHARPFIIDPDLLYQATEKLVGSERLFIEEKRAYLPTLYKAEHGIASAIERLLEAELEKISKDEIYEAVEDVEKQLQIQYDEIQKEAIVKAMNSPLFILTGGPGTGKTTVIEGIIQTYAQIHEVDLIEDSATHPKILQAAPTGRAAKRMEEATGIPARTIHSMLQLKVDETEDIFEEAEITLEGNLLIVDEMSMIDTWLMNQLLTAVPCGMQVIFIGDPYQLPPVGPGQVFRDLIEVNLLPIIQLNKIYRQAQGSSIIELAYEIKQGRLPQNFLEQTQDRNFFAAQMQEIPALIEVIVGKAIDKGFTAEDIQVLSPMYKTPAGINHLNVCLQALFNPPNPEKEEVEFNQQIFRVGDKILQTKNDPEQGVFNGDMGVITGFVDKQYTLSKRDEMILEFNGKEVYYTRSDWIHLSLAYACSIHKAQGSEYPIVILPLVPAFRRMLKRDLLYTAVTRASQSLILCGDPNSFIDSLKSTSASRKTTLRERLLGNRADEIQEPIEEVKSDESSELNDENHFILTPQKILEGQIDPLIGMENITPYDD